jgi:phosphatidyl-myo-inositol dimannoside synthase
MRRINLLAIGHSYVLSVNRATLREIAKDPAFDITVAAPSFFRGDLRPIICEPEPKGSLLKVHQIKTRWTGKIHMFHYEQTALRRLLGPGQWDAIHIWEEPYILAGYQISRLAHRSAAPFCFRTAQSLSKSYPPPFRGFERSCMKWADRWIAGSTTVYENLIKRGYPKDRGRILNLAVDTALFAPTNESVRSAVQNELGLSGPVIGFVGRLVEAKGLRQLMRAMELVNPDLSWSLLLLGSGELKNEIEAWAERREWSRRVKILLAKHDEMPRFMSAMDVMVAPSQTMSNWKEQFGRMLIEAFASGVPVIASDSGEIPHVVGDAGTIVREKDVAGWAEAITRALIDEPWRQSKSAAGLQRAGRFSVKCAAEKFSNFYLELAAAHNPETEKLSP